MSVKMIRASSYLWTVSDHTYQSRLGLSGLERDSWNHSWSDGGVVHDEVGDDADAALVGRLDEVAHVVDDAVVGVDREEVRDVVAAVAQRGAEVGQQPDAVDAQPLQVVELLGQAAEVARAVAVGVEEAADVDLVEDRGLEPQRLLLEPVAGVAHASTRSTWARTRIQAHVVAADAPVEVRPRQQVVDREGGREAEVGRDHAGALLGIAGVDVDDADDRVARNALDVGDQRLVVGLEEGDVLEPLQRRVLAPDLVDAADHRQQRAVERALLGLVLLGVEVLLGALAHRHVLEPLVARVDPVGRAERAREHEPRGERRRPAVLQVGVEDVGRVDEEVGAEVLALGAVGELVDVLGQLPAGVLPGEVRVGLGEADLRQVAHDRAAGEGLGEEDDRAVDRVDLLDQPLPERERLRVRVVDAEELDAGVDPGRTTSSQACQSSRQAGVSQLKL